MYAGTHLCRLGTKKISSLSCDSRTSVQPHHISRVRQHVGHKVIEKWEWGVTSCWSENVVRWLWVKPSGFKLYHTFPSALKYLTLMMVFQLCTGNVWHVKSNSHCGSKWLMDVKYFSHYRQSQEWRWSRHQPPSHEWSSLAVTTFSWAIDRNTCNWKPQPNVTGKSNQTTMGLRNNPI